MSAGTLETKLQARPYHFKLLSKDRLLVEEPEPERKKRSDELFARADKLQIVASVHERDAKRYEQAGNKEQQEYLLGQAEECRKESAAWYAYACEHYPEKF